MVNTGLITTLILQELPKKKYILWDFFSPFDIYLSLEYLVPPHRDLSLSKIFVEFSLKHGYATWLWKIFKFMVFRILENPFAIQKIKSRHFYLCPIGSTFPTSLSSPLPPQAEGNCSFPPARHFFKNLFPPAEEGEETMCMYVSYQW